MKPLLSFSPGPPCSLLATPLGKTRFAPRWPRSAMVKLPLLIIFPSSPWYAIHQASASLCFRFCFCFCFFYFLFLLPPTKGQGAWQHIYICIQVLLTICIGHIGVPKFWKKHEPRLISPLDTVFLLYKNVPPLLENFHLKNKRRAHTRPFISLVQLNMVINESMRLYPPATVLPRMAFEDIKLGDLHIPKGLSIWIPVLAIHHSEELWGKDANEFNPDRFAGKMFAPGRHFIPFAAGPRNCVGQSFAMMEAKIILAMLVSRFSFTISQNYRHAPVIILTIKPKYGVQICLKPLKPWSGSIQDTALGCSLDFPFFFLC